jgi:hypothetical protein
MDSNSNPSVARAVASHYTDYATEALFIVGTSIQFHRNSSGNFLTEIFVQADFFFLNFMNLYLKYANTWSNAESLLSPRQGKNLEEAGRLDFRFV